MLRLLQGRKEGFMGLVLCSMKHLQSMLVHRLLIMIRLFYRRSLLSLKLFFNPRLRRSIASMPTLNTSHRRIQCLKTCIEEDPNRKMQTRREMRRATRWEVFRPDPRRELIRPEPRQEPVPEPVLY